MFKSSPIHFMPDATGESRWYRISEWVGFVGLLLFCFFSLLSIAGANIGLALMLLGLIASPRAWPQLLRQPLFWASLLAIAYIVVNRFLPTVEIAGKAGVQSDQARDWALIFFFPLIAWWISRHPNRRVLALGLMLSGFGIGMLSAIDATLIEQIRQGVRSGMHFGKPVIFGFDSAVAVLATIVLGIYWLSPRLELSRVQRAIRIGLTLVAMLFFAQGVVISQSRGVWLSLLVALPVMIFLLWRGLKPVYGLKKRTGLWVISAMLVFFALVLATNWDTLENRLSHEREALGVVVEQGLDKAPLGSSTYRLHLWRFGFEKWLERPFTGWGAGTTFSLVDAENLESLKHFGTKSFDHLHSAYLEVLLQLGLIGFILFVWSGILILKCIFKGYRLKQVSVYMYAFYLANFVLIAVYSLTDFRHLHWNWRFYWLVLAGMVFSYCLNMMDSKDSAPS